MQRKTTKQVCFYANIILSWCSDICVLNPVTKVNFSWMWMKLVSKRHFLPHSVFFFSFFLTGQSSRAVCLLLLCLLFPLAAFNLLLCSFFCRKVSNLHYRCRRDLRSWSKYVICDKFKKYRQKQNLAAPSQGNRGNRGNKGVADTQKAGEEKKRVDPPPTDLLTSLTKGAALTTRITIQPTSSL